ncbi:MAG TPA: hypothetical protein VF411_14295, partial [Bacteroidia bacterium]
MDYISKTDAGFDSWQKNFINVLIAFYIAWAIRVADEANLITLKTAWEAAFATGGKNMVASR